ncbi:MAG: hypothetical protein ACI9LM_004929 [Alteromonadaceae bacterium]|jgi:hypothetical protein
MSVNLLFYIFFIAQIFLISYYFPRKVIQKVDELLKRFPATDYPKLYPQSVDKVIKGQWIFTLLNQIILVVGLVLLFAYGLLSTEYDENQKHTEGLPIFYGMLQFSPYILMELAGFKQFKLMKSNDQRKSRTADLQPRRLFDFVSPLLLISAVLIGIAYFVFELYVNNFTLNAEIIPKFIAIVLCNSLFIVLTLRNLYGKKLDPFQANKDRLRQICFATNSMVKISIIASLFFTITTATEVFNLAHFEVIFNSLYFQAIAFMGLGSTLQAMNLDEIDFEVYKESNVTN